jgi:lipopolysaccharide/colanic/teichoic acid biosynthesis glycosyltransferase
MKLPDLQTLKGMDFNELDDPDKILKLKKVRTFYLVVKRMIDIFVASIIVVLLAPLWILVIILIRATSSGKAIFAHERVGKDQKVFRCYKFRTMYQNVNGYEFAPTCLSDTRITPIGRVLRRTSLDEIPQFFNVLKGDMTLIGPRPEMPFIANNYTVREQKRLLVKPGITGLWQVSGRKDVPLHKNVEYDLYYIIHRSLKLDFVILVKTFYVIINGKGAY